MPPSWLSDETTLALLCCFAPPVIVKRKRGVHWDFWLSIELTLVGWLPGVMFAVYILFADEDPPRRAVSTSQDDTRRPMPDEDDDGEVGIRQKRRRDRWKRLGRARESSASSGGEV